MLELGQGRGSSPREQGVAQEGIQDPQFTPEGAFREQGFLCFLATLAA